MTLKTAILMLACLTLFAEALPVISAVEDDCGFSKFQPVRISDFGEGTIISRVEPRYPPAAKAKGLSGTVKVNILINKQGLVERTCPVYLSGEPKPDRSLVVTAEAAALQWVFQPNFGLRAVGGPDFDYVQQIVIFNFDPTDVSKKKSGKK